MSWSPFWGAFAGGTVGALLVFSVFLILDFLEQRRVATQTERRRAPTLDDILESQLRDHIVAHFGELFPGWRVVDEPANEGDDGGGMGGGQPESSTARRRE